VRENGEREAVRRKCAAQESANGGKKKGIRKKGKERKPIMPLLFYRS
jgi:hypothetical protein